MILAIVFAQLWGVIQLIILGSLSRTVRVRTVLAAMAVGLYACLLYTSPSPRDTERSRMPSSA